MVVAVVLVGFVVAGLPFVLFGVHLLRLGVRRVGERAAFRATPWTTVADLQAGMVAKLTGTARSGPETLAGPFSGASAVAVAIEVEERRFRSGDSGKEWRTVHESTQVVPFRVADEGGSVAVDPDPVALRVGGAHETTVRVDGGERPPDRVEEFVTATEGLDAAASGLDLGRLGTVAGEPRRYRERAIRPGDQVVIHGPTERDADAEWGDSLVVRPGTDGIVTNRSASALDRVGRLTIAGYLGGGTLLVVGPLAVLAYVLAELGAF